MYSPKNGNIGFTQPAKTKAPNLQLDRRSLLKGLGYAGVLSATQIEKAFAQTSAPLRVMVVALQHGWGHGGSIIDRITGSENNFTLPDIWKGFNPIKDQCVFVDGLRGTFWGNAHDVSYSDILTAGVPIKAPEERELLGGPFPLPISPSIDHLLEKELNTSVLRFSAKYGSFGAAHHPMSFNDRLQSLPYYTSPYQAYNSIYSARTTTQKTGNQALILEQLFPYLSSGLASELQSLPPSEANKLLNYLDASADLKSKLSRTTDVPTGGLELSHVPGNKQTLIEMIDSYLEMIRVSFSNNTHRVAVLGMNANHQDFEWTDASGTKRMGYSDYTGDFHHDIAHFKDKPLDSQLAYEGWVKYYVNKIVNFAQDMQSTIDIDGNSLLDNTLIILTGEVGDGNHGRRNKPHVIIGGGNRLQKGRWLHVPKVDAHSIGGRTPSGKYQTIPQTQSYSTGEFSQFTHADLWTKVANMMDVNISSFGIDVLNTQPLNL